MSKNKTISLAERCFAATDIDMELFDAVNDILGCDTSDCLKPGFQFRVLDTFWDNYDSSLEVVISNDAAPLTRSEVNKLLDLGFSCVYENSIDRGTCWTRTMQHPCRLANAEGHDAKNLIIIRELRKQIADLEERLEVLKRQDAY